MNKMFRVTARWAPAIALLFIAGCASLSKPAAPMPAHDAHWQGRLALRIHSEPVQAFSAFFDLQGDAQAGVLTFFTPIGSTAARLEWNSHGAQLQTTGEPQQFASVDALTRHTTGATLPIPSMFAWLKGINAATPGWEVDLQGFADGKILAKRLAPETAVDLKITLDR